MRSRLSAGLLAVADLAVLAGCGCTDSNPPVFGVLHSVKGVVKRGGQPVAGGVITFTSQLTKSEFLINSEVGPDGTFSLTMVRITDTSGQRKPGARAGT